METVYQDLIGSVYSKHHDEILAWLQRRYARICPALVQDAVADAFQDALARPRCFVSAWQQSGQGGLLRLLKNAAWRRLRGHLRKKSSRCELHQPFIVESAGAPGHARHWLAEALVDYRAELVQTQALVNEAAQRFGGKRHEALRLALQERLQGASDSEAARAHGVPREYVNRAKRWIAAQLEARRL